MQTDKATIDTPGVVCRLIVQPLDKHILSQSVQGIHWPHLGFQLGAAVPILCWLLLGVLRRKQIERIFFPPKQRS